jgi:protein-S-isoprenylcysteine O-methyltransferase Ste14
MGDLSAETSSAPTKMRFAISRSDLFGYHRGPYSPVIWECRFNWPTAKGTWVFTSPAMTDSADTANVIIRPPIAWALAVLAGLAMQWVVYLPFMPAPVPAGWVGGMVFVLALMLIAWAIATITRAGSNVPTSMPTTTIVETGPYRFTRNPIYLGMFLGLVGLAIAFDNLWLLGMLVPFALVMRYGVVAREEAYLESKFGNAYRHYRTRVRRWL